MKIRTIVTCAVAALTMTACSGATGGGNASNATAGNASASFDPNSDQGRAYRSAVECAGTLAAAKSLVGGVFHVKDRR